MKLAFDFGVVNAAKSHCMVGFFWSLIPWEFVVVILVFQMAMIFVACGKCRFPLSRFPRGFNNSNRTNTANNYMNRKNKTFYAEAVPVNSLTVAAEAEIEDHNPPLQRGECLSVLRGIHMVFRVINYCRDCCSYCWGRPRTTTRSRRTVQRTLHSYTHTHTWP